MAGLTVLTAYMPVTLSSRSLEKEMSDATLTEQIKVRHSFINLPKAGQVGYATDKMGMLPQNGFSKFSVILVFSISTKQ